MSFRTENVRVRGRKNRSESSTRWLRRQLNDPYVQLAQKEGYRSRSAYKLKQIDDKVGLLRKGMRVVDLGCAPGGWLQVAADKGCTVIGIDLLPVEPLAGAELIQGDFLDNAVYEQLRAMIDGKVDLVLSDLAAAATGQKLTDRLRAENIGEAVLAFAAETLKPGGDALIKTVRGADQPLVQQARDLFTTTRLIRPEATRKDSSEVFLLAHRLRRSEPNND
ncbi:MAG: RlmE family RNA methyltransferase [Geminicoccaceae bacterium]